MLIADKYIKENNSKEKISEIMNQIRESGFTNSLLDFYKDEKTNNFEIVLYVFRDDIIKASSVLESIRGVKNVTWDQKKEYIHVEYDPNMIGIRYMLEYLKKKKNIDAYYDEDKEKQYNNLKNKGKKKF